MLPRHRWRLLLPLLAASVLAACHRDDTERAPAQAAAAMRTLVTDIQRNDLAGFWRDALPPADYRRLRSGWKQRTVPVPSLSTTDRLRVDDALRQLGAPGAKTVLASRLQPRLAAVERQYGDQWPLLVGIGHALLRQDIDAQARLTPTQKHDAQVLLDALTPWARQAPWFDPAHARDAIDVAVDTAQALRLRSVEQWRALDFDDAMHRGGLAFRGLGRALALYGWSVEDTLGSVRVTPLTVHGDRATVRLDYHVLHKPLSATLQMQRIDGHWYSRAIVEALKKHDPKPQPRPEAAYAVPPPAGSAAVSPQPAPLQ